jgi:hypothetical protein
MAALMFLASMPLTVVHAAMVTTDQVIDQTALQGDRARVEAFMARADVRREMAAMGVDPDEAIDRIAGLSDREILQIATYIDQDPAGQSAVAAIIGALLLVFIILLITDLIGWTHVFPFVHSGPR